MFAIVKTAEGWTVQDVATGSLLTAGVPSLLEANRDLIDVVAGTYVLPSAHDPLCACGNYRESCVDCSVAA